MNRELFMKDLKSSLIDEKIALDDIEDILKDYENHFILSEKNQIPIDEVIATLGDPKELAKEYAWMRDMDKASAEKSIMKFWNRVAKYTFQFEKVGVYLIASMFLQVTLIMLLIGGCMLYAAGGLCLVGVVIPTNMADNFIVVDGLSNTIGNRFLFLISGIVLILLGRLATKLIWKKELNLKVSIVQYLKRNLKMDIQRN